MYVPKRFRPQTVSTDNIPTDYTYDGDGIRVSKTTNNVTTSHILDGMNVVADINGTTVSKYNRGLNLFAQIVGDEQTIFYHNQHGDIASQYVSADDVNYYTYDGFGNHTDNASISTPFGYAGEYQDLCSGLIYLRNRYYDPSIGRFISEDPIKSGTNWYVYCGNNPVNYIDPSGLISVIFYGEGMGEQARIREIYYTQKYNSVTYSIGVKSSEQFIDSWKRFFDSDYPQTIDAIEIISHGSIEGAVGKDKNGEAYSTGYIYFTNTKVNKLYARNIDGMLKGERN